MLTAKQNIINRKIIMLSSGMTQVEIADKLKVVRQTLNNYIIGTRKNIETQRAICKLLNVEPEVFFPEFFENTVSHDDKINVSKGDVN